MIFEEGQLRSLGPIISVDEVLKERTRCVSKSQRGRRGEERRGEIKETHLNGISLEVFSEGCRLVVCGEEGR